MHYYKRHVGDYAKKAGHLSVLEHGVYTLLLDAYYDREQAPTKAEAIRISRCRTADELAALDAVLADFFILTDGRYVQPRVEHEFVLAEEAAQRNRDNGKAGGRPRKPKGAAAKTQPEPKRNPVGSERVATGNPNESEKNPNPLIHQSINPENQEQAAPPAAEPPAEKVDKAKAGSRIPAGWAPSDDLRAWAAKKRPDLDVAEQVEKFNDHWGSMPGAKGRKTDWNGTFRNWIRNERKQFGATAVINPAVPRGKPAGPSESPLEQAVAHARRLFSLDQIDAAERDRMIAEATAKHRGQS